MANEFKVKNGIKFPDNTIQTTAATGGGGSSTLTISNKTGAYTVVAGDLGTIINCTSGTFTVSLTAAATLGSGFNCWIWNTSTSSFNSITVDPNGSETIDGSSTLILRRGEGLQIVCDGTNWQTGDKKTMRGYAENLGNSVSRPIASGSSAIAMGEASSAINSYSSAFGRAANASGLGANAIGLNATASSNYSSAIGSSSGGQGAVGETGAGAMALGGSYASGTDSFAAAVANNTSSYGATGSNSVAVGYLAKATGIYAVAIGVEAQATASGAPSFSIGQESIASGVRSIAFGSYLSAAQENSVALGYGSSSSIYGKYAFSGYGIDGFTKGVRQTGTFVLMRDSVGTTPVVLTTSNLAPSATNQIILPNNSAHAFTGIIIARQQAAGGTASAAWEIKGLIRREGSAAATVLVNSAITVLSNVPGWSLALSADTTNGGLAITVTGATSTNIRWVATIQTSEVTYA